MDGVNKKAKDTEGLWITKTVAKGDNEEKFQVSKNHISTDTCDASKSSLTITNPLLAPITPNSRT